jgi:hypothetical protein
LDDSPEGLEEVYHFRHPELLVSATDTRNVLENFDYHQDILQKKKFAKFSYLVAIPWGILLILSVIGQGWQGGWKLDTSEFIAVVTTTTGSVFGFAYVLGRYLYGSKAYSSKTIANDSVQSDASK